MSFTIAFRGLICHVEDGGEARAVLVDEHGHDPTLIVHADDLLGTPIGEKWKDIEPVGVFYLLPLSMALLLDAPAIKLSERPTRLKFADHVPSLKEILDTKDIDAKAKKGDVDHHGVAASLQYGSGTLKPKGCWGRSVKWSGSGGNPPTCVAKEIVYEVAAGDNVTIRTADDKYAVQVKEDATVWVTNRNVGNHFHAFTHLSTKSKLARIPTEDKGCNDCKPTEIPPDANVECSNSSYP